MADSIHDVSVRENKFAQYQGKQNVIDISRRLAASGENQGGEMRDLGRALSLEVKAVSAASDEASGGGGNAEISVAKARSLAASLRNHLAQLNLGIVSANPELLGRVIR